MVKFVLRYLIRFFPDTLQQLYEELISLPHGIAQFIGNVASIQLTKLQYLVLTSPSKHLGDLYLTTYDSRPLLRYKWWPKGMEWKEDMPECEVIVELRGMQVRDLGKEEWELVDMSDERLMHLRDLFLGFAFYQPLRKEHVREIENAG